MKKMLLCATAVLVLGSLAWAKGKTFTGVVSDEHCGAMHATASAEAQQCVEKCVSGGSKYVLVSNGKVYKLDAQDKFKGMGGKEVTVTGTAKGNSITVSDVAEKM